MDWMSHESRANNSMKLHTAMDQVDISVDAIALPTPMPRHDAKRGVSTSVALLTPATLLKTRDGQCGVVYGRVHFSDESSPAAHGLVPHPTLVVAA